MPQRATKAETKRMKQQWKVEPPLPNESTNQVVCKHCTIRFAANASRQFRHLDICRPYQKWKGETLTVTRTGRSVLQQLQQPSPPSADLLNEAAAAVILEGGLPLSLFDQPAIRAFIRLIRPPGSEWLPPSRTQIRDRWITEIYLKMRQQVIDEIIRPNDSNPINIIFDASDDAASRRQFNISIATPGVPAVFWRMLDTGGVRHTAEETASLVHTEISTLIQTADERVNWNKVNAFVSDTCNTAVATARSLTSKPELRHAFTVFCDSHGLQLLVKDLFSSEGGIRETLLECMSLTSYFKSSTLQLARLRNEQRMLYGHEMAILTGCWTRWGSHFKALTSLQRTYGALQAWAATMDRLNIEGCLSGPEANSVRPHIQRIQSTNFWGQLDALIALLAPLDEAIKTSEADGSDLGYVVKRWKDVKISWERGTYTKFKALPWTFIFNQFDSRMKRQCTDINWFAYALHPDRYPLTQDEHATAIRMIDLFAPDPLSAEQIRNEFIEFRARSGQYSYARSGWTQSLQPRLFWLHFAGLPNPKLATVACRVFGCIANSVPAERAFSSTNFIKNSLSSRITSSVLDMWLFIYINSRVLAHMKDESQSLVDQSESQDLDVDALIERFVGLGRDSLDPDS